MGTLGYGKEGCTLSNARTHVTCGEEVKRGTSMYIEPRRVDRDHIRNVIMHTE